MYKNNHFTKQCHLFCRFSSKVVHRLFSPAAVQLFPQRHVLKPNLADRLFEYIFFLHMIRRPPVSPLLLLLQSLTKPRNTRCLAACSGSELKYILTAARAEIGLSNNKKNIFRGQTILSLSPPLQKAVQKAH